jgi:hypothetical protein
MKTKSKASMSEERFQRSTDDIIRRVLDETSQELRRDIRKKDNVKKNSKKVSTAVTGQ